MKLSGWILRVSLIAMIALSLVFTWLIWQNPSRLGREETTAVVQTKKDPNIAKLKSTVMAPTAVYYQQNAQKWQLFEADNDAAQTVRLSMAKWRLGTVGTAVRLSADDFTKLLASQDTVQLHYSGMITYRTFNSGFFNKKATATNGDFQFDRILFDFAHPDRLAFINDETRQVRYGNLSNANTAALRQTVDDTLPNAFAISEMRLGTRQVAVYRDQIQVQPYAYLLDQQSANHYVALLMPAQQASAIDSREIGAETVYTVGTNYRLTLTTSSGLMEFENAASANRKKDLQTALTKAYSGLGSLNLLGLNAVRYFSCDRTSQETTFRAFAQGLPIFNGEDNGKVTVASTSSGLQIDFSTNNLIVPIPTQQAKTTLPTTATVLAQLKKDGYATTGIQDIVLGYYWHTQAADSQVVALTPTYFVEINGEYRRYTQWLASGMLDDDSKANTAQPLE
ncbi:YycH family regulatory protein [Lacticaseibacillus mingshuiensis]|uniref:YycH family regulatory protein n=1 Tax=Lacticaseibacillus mingshuiensis TaxID=2799574 RepID=A0ABW4CFS3_9LACO|nr:two-component system activity regulator YycH [Lacticaseibacillus mingshuiensis]